MTQLSQQKHSPRGRRFSLEDKVMCLALLKESPKGYKLLRKIFAIPSRKTLTNLLGKIPFACGINEGILNSLQTNVRKMKR